MSPYDFPKQKQPPTHNPVKDAIELVLAVSRAGFAGHICDGSRCSVVKL